MYLNKNRWFVRLFSWSLGLWAQFNGNVNEYRHQERTNLCHFARVIVVYMPLVLLLHLLLVVTAFVALIATPIHLFGAVNYFIVMGGIAVAVLIPIGVKKTIHTHRMKRLAEERKGGEEGRRS